MELFKEYSNRFKKILDSQNWDNSYLLANDMRVAWQSGKRLYICGNGGSAGNAIHLANDFNYGIAKMTGIGLRVMALPANSAVISCIANDISYSEIFSQQLAVHGEPGDILIVLSGSGNSPNVVRALEKAKELDMKSFAILGYAGGKCKDLADVSIHFPIDDMQIAEDMQLVVGHMIMQWLCKNPVIR